MADKCTVDGRMDGRMHGKKVALAHLYYYDNWCSKFGRIVGSLVGL